MPNDLPFGSMVPLSDFVPVFSDVHTPDVHIDISEYAVTISSPRQEHSTGQMFGFWSLRGLVITGVTNLSGSCLTIAFYLDTDLEYLVIWYGTGSYGSDR